MKAQKILVVQTLNYLFYVLAEELLGYLTPATLRLDVLTRKWEEAAPGLGWNLVRDTGPWFETEKNFISLQVEQLLGYLTPANLRLDLLTRKWEEAAAGLGWNLVRDTEPWFETPYVAAAIPPETLASWDRPNGEHMVLSPTHLSGFFFP
jgi:hypothetical protein